MKTARKLSQAEIPEKYEVPCPVCEADDYYVLYEPWVEVEDPVRLYGAATSIPGTQRIVVCQRCTMKYENPRYSEDIILQGYSSSEEASHDSQYEMRVTSFYRTLKSLRKHLPGAEAKVLDVGCAGGGFLEAAKRYGYHAIGIDPSAYLVDHGRKRGLDVRQGTIGQLPFTGHKFDLICLWDVLEHVTHPRKTLETLRPLLKKNGVLLINYPDIGTMQAKLAGKRFWWIISGHLHYFSRSTASDLCRRAGYETVHIQRYWQTLEFGYLEGMAVHFKIPLSGLAKRLTPSVLQRIPIPYYASQTTLLARLK